MIEIDEDKFFNFSKNIIFMDERTAVDGLIEDIHEGLAIDEQLFAQMMGWA